MPTATGKIVLMGSGELTATMVEVHKELIAGLPRPHRLVFLDTPAGFQLNVDQISETAARYFQTRVLQSLEIASFKSAEGSTAQESERAFRKLRNAQFVLLGPGSPTYSVRQMERSPIPEIFSNLIKTGGCLVAASAAALTMGSHTLPVYEIYKVGESLHWTQGLNILPEFGFNMVVIPHWNNAEGGTHDTRRCFMGESRFQTLEGLLPDDLSILGLDEHTACIIDLQAEQVAVKGLGRVIVKHGRQVRVFTKGDLFPADVLRGAEGDPEFTLHTAESQRKGGQPPDRSAFWRGIHAMAADFQTGLAAGDPALVTRALLEIDRAIWRGKQELESEETVSEARELFRDHLVALGSALPDTAGEAGEVLAPIVDGVLELRGQLRERQRFDEADALRRILQRGGIQVEDSPEGVRWRIGRS